MIIIFAKFIYPLLVCYLIGSIPTSYILAKVLKGVDIRKYGSGNVGATNLMRVIGKGPGIIGLLFDILKGFFPVLILAPVSYMPGLCIGQPLYKVLLGAALVSGHIWPIFLKFKGGKGVATSIGVLIALSYKAMLLGLLVWLLTALLFRYVSLSSIVMVFTLPIFMVLFRQPIEYILLSVLLCIFIVIKHMANIRRLINGTEYKIGQKL